MEVKTETDNILVDVSNLDETIGAVQEGRTLIEVGGDAEAEVVKIVRNSQNQITQIYLRDVTGTFESGDNVSVLMDLHLLFLAILVHLPLVFFILNLV